MEDKDNRSKSKKKIFLWIFVILGILAIIVVSFPFIYKKVVPLPKEAKEKIKKLEAEIEKLEKTKKEKEKALNKLLSENKDKKDSLRRNNENILNMQLYLFKAKYGHFPSKKEIYRAIFYYPIEPYSMSNKLYLSFNGKGGWYYDLKTKKIYPNVKKSDSN